MLKKLSLLLLLLILTACSSLDPFLEPFLPTLPATIDPGPGLIPSQTAVSSVTPELTLAVTVTPTSTDVKTDTPIPVTPTLTLVPPTQAAATAPSGAMLYQVQAGTPVYIGNFAHAAQACQWLSVAGQVFDASGNPVINLVVQVSGTLSGQPLDFTSLTGVALDYGPGGYEVTLADHSVTSTGTLFIQLFDLQAHPLSNLIPFNTSADCTKNVTIINFAP